HFVVKVVAFAGAFAHARKHRDATVQLRDVVDEFHDDNRFAHAGAAERADLAALEEGADEVNDLDAGGENLGAGGLVHQRRGAAVNRAKLVRLHAALLVDGIAGNVEHAAHDRFADGHGDGLAGVGQFHAALEPFGGAHGDGAHPVVAQVLLHFEGQLGAALAGQVVLDGEGVVDGRQLVREFHVHDRPDDLDNFAFVHFARMLRAFSFMGRVWTIGRRHAITPSPSGRW